MTWREIADRFIWESCIWFIAGLIASVLVLATGCSSGTNWRAVTGAAVVANNDLSDFLGDIVKDERYKTVVEAKRQYLLCQQDDDNERAACRQAAINKVFAAAKERLAPLESLIEMQNRIADIIERAQRSCYVDSSSPSCLASLDNLKGIYKDVATIVEKAKALYKHGN